MVKARKYVLTRRYEGRPKESDYKIIEEELPALKNGEILVKTEFISVDPYLYVLNKPHPLPYAQEGYQVGIILESKNPKFPPGTHVVSHKGWTDYYVANPDDPGFADFLEHLTEPHFGITKVPDLKGLPLSYAVGVIGMPGASAYFGLLELTRPKSGETVVVTGAAGALGSIAGQIAKIKGCRVIGFAGSDEKVEWLEKELGFDKAFNYKTVDVAAALKEAAPNGVDVFIDNVGGEISSTIISQMNLQGRVGVCGSISTYNESVLPKVTSIQMYILSKRLEVRGLNVFRRTVERWEEAFKDMVNWIKSGKIKVREHVTEGFDKVPEAFVGVFLGKNVGKAVVKV